MSNLGTLLRHVIPKKPACKNLADGLYSHGLYSPRVAPRFLTVEAE